jgi:hypothetical protein
VQQATASSLGLFSHLVQDRFELGRALCVAQDEIVGQQGNALHVQQDNVGAQSFGDGIDNDMSKFNWFQDSTSIPLDVSWTLLS